jgi:hypothetical protein
LYFVGLNFLYAMTSDTVSGVPRDAKRAVDAIVKRLSSVKTSWDQRVGDEAGAVVHG